MNLWGAIRGSSAQATNRCNSRSPRLGFEQLETRETLSVFAFVDSEPKLASEHPAETAAAIEAVLAVDQPFRVSPGTQLTFTGMGKGGSGKYEFRFLLRSHRGGWEVVRDYSESPTWRWDTSGFDSDLFYAQVHVRSTGSSARSEATAAPIPIILADVSAATGARLVSDQSSHVVPGTTVRFEATASGGAGRYEFQFRQRSSQEGWRIVQDYSFEPHWSWSTSNLPTDSYLTQVLVRSAGSPALREAASAPVTHIVAVHPAAIGATLSSNHEGRVAPGTTVEFHGEGQGASGEFEFRFLRRSENDGWKVARDYSPDPNWAWDTAGGSSDLFFVQLHVRSAGSPAKFEARATPIELLVSEHLPATGVLLESDQPLVVSAGSKIRFTGSGIGGTGEYEFRFRLKSENGAWETVRDYDVNRFWNWDTTGSVEDRYYVQLHVRAKGSRSLRDASAVPIVHDVAGLPQASNVGLLLSIASPVRVGEQPTLRATGNNGDQVEFQFRFLTDDGNWVLIREYDRSPTATWNTTLVTPGVYEVRVDARKSRPLGRSLSETSHVDLIEVRENAEQLWDRLVRDYLQSDLWSDRDAYDAGHTLMIPLQAAFQSGNRVWLQQFADHFSEMLNAGAPTESLLARLQYYYVASRFMHLAASHDREALIPPSLPKMLSAEVVSLWQDVPAWQWARQPFEGGMRERLDWKLNTSEVRFSFYRAIISQELYVLAIASEIRAYERESAANVAPHHVIDEMLQVAFTIFSQEVVQTGTGGWLLQPGIWTDHPDYAYSGHPAIAADLPPAPVPGIATDTSHSHRLPVWLTSLGQAYGPESDLRAFYQELISGLEVQFYDTVLVPPNNEIASYRTTNYMDGANTIYRYRHATQGANNGFGPYELSGTLTFGWWAFLDTDRIRAVYGHVASQFPLDSSVLDSYVGPNTSRERHPSVTLPAAFTNGFRELITLLASSLRGV